MVFVTMTAILQVRDKNDLQRKWNEYEAIRCAGIHDPSVRYRGVYADPDDLGSQQRWEQHCARYNDRVI